MVIKNKPKKEMKKTNSLICKWAVGIAALLSPAVAAASSTQKIGRAHV